MYTAGDYSTGRNAHSHNEAKSFQKPAFLDMVYQNRADVSNRPTGTKLHVAHVFYADSVLTC